ncbi:hypothetical protein [Phytohabitans aurantiacus]|uniref:hypothetical protein n=1 Tax=Phytohabitans aurantiacus TaxID=3016789 RepID=UPI0024901AD7|nr:hypothetical protein [Phytohabitans aurantiacus]
MATELPELSPAECRRRAEQAAQQREVGESVMWALLAISGDLSALRRELRQGRR